MRKLPSRKAHNLWARDERWARCTERCGDRVAFLEKPGVMDPHIFFGAFSKILILKNLRGGDRVESAQNLEPQGLIAKIFWNKDLAAD